MDDHTPSLPPFDWQSEQTGQKRDLSRFATELGRVLSLRGSSGPARAAADRLRDRWGNLVRRVEGRWVRGRDAWDRQTEMIERLASERSVLDALVAYDQWIEKAADIDSLLRETLTVIERAVPCDGVLIDLPDLGGQPRQAATQRRRGRPWPPVADTEMASYLQAGAADGHRIVIEGRPVGSGRRDLNRVAHWLAVGVLHRSDGYGAIVIGRRAGEEAFGDAAIDALERIGQRLGRALARRVGVGVRPLLGAGPKPEGFEHLWGESPAYRRAVALAARFALSDSPVLLEGEIGSGRETLARAIHRRSPRADKPFVVFRGSDLPEDVVARQLFGVVESSAEGQSTTHPGDWELADGGTLYLDEIAHLATVHQVRLVRYLNEGTFERVGDRTELTADVRLIIATSANLEELLARGGLREDLYYLITAARITIPPLRERAGDIIELARRFAVTAGEKAGKTITGIDADAARVLVAALFPGNVRQLEQVIARAVYLTTGNLVSASDLPSELSAHVVAAPLDATGWVEAVAGAVRQAVRAGTSGDYADFRRARKQSVQALESAFTAAVEKAVGHHPSRAARHCGIHRAQWWRLAHAQNTMLQDETASDEESGGKSAE